MWPCICCYAPLSASSLHSSFTHAVSHRGYEVLRALRIVEAKGPGIAVAAATLSMRLESGDYGFRQAPVKDGDCGYDKLIKLFENWVSTTLLTWIDRPFGRVGAILAVGIKGEGFCRKSLAHKCAFKWTSPLLMAAPKHVISSWCLQASWKGGATPCHT